MCHVLQFHALQFGPIIFSAPNWSCHSWRPFWRWSRLPVTWVMLTGWKVAKFRANARKLCCIAMLEVKSLFYVGNLLPLQWAQLTEAVHTARLGLEFVFLCFLGCMIYLYVGVCFVLPWTVESLPFMLWRWHNKHKWAPFKLFAPSSSLRVRSWLPLRAIVNKKAMRDEGVIYVARHPLLNRRCTVQDSQGVSVSQNSN